MKPIKKNEMELNKIYYAIDDRQDGMVIGYVKPIDCITLTITVLGSIENKAWGYEAVPVTKTPFSGIKIQSLSDNVQLFKLSRDEELLHIVAEKL